MLINYSGQTWINMSNSCAFDRSYHTFNYISKTHFKGECISNDVINDDETESTGEPITFTIPSENICQLQNESEKKYVSLNIKINQIIKEYLDWHADAPQAKMFYLPKSFITSIVEQLSERQLSGIAQSTVNDLKDMSLLLRGEFNFSAFLGIIQSWLRVTQTPYRYEQTEHGYKIIIRHGMGYKCSYLIKEVCRHIIEERFDKLLRYNITDNTVLLKIAD
jgi:hypothetical protein